MDVVQWLTPRPGSDDVAVCFAPPWAVNLPPHAGLPALRRRSATLVSRHLTRPFAVAVAADLVDDEAPLRLPGTAGAVSLRIALSANGVALLDAGASDVRFAAVLGEFVGVVVDLCEAAGLPLLGAQPVDERRALQLLLGALQGNARARLADALLLFAGAVETCALARGFEARCSLLHGSRIIPINARIEVEL